MSRLITWLVVSLGIFATGFRVGVVSHVGDRLVDVRIRNESGSPIAKVELIHEHGTAIVRDVAPGAAELMRFYAPGETSYRTVVQFAAGGEMTSDEVYAEAGYRVTETVTAHGIERQIRLY